MRPATSMVHLDRTALTSALIRLLARRTRYLEKEMLGLRQIVASGDVCVDIGAAAGLYTVVLSELVGATGHVLRVEPLPFVHPLWTRLLRAGGNVSHHAVALGAEPSQGTMSVPMGRYGLVTGRSFLAWRTNGVGSNSEFAGHVEVNVKVDTLDALCAKAELSRLDFLKIDVEGAELHVLAGGAGVIEKFRPAILVEIEARHLHRYGHSVGTVVDWLRQRGYTMHRWLDGWRETTEVSDQQRNYLFRVP
ncbi:MAG TPA: FkbM family methyltransferase [Pseudonocardiaceae bacterium]|nr:FkbM family methyltransferase [Pseudonocardiaceae bacterium]